MKTLLGVVLAAALGLALFVGALALTQAQRLDMPWDLATLRQPNELKHRLRAILSSFSAQPIPTDDMRPIAHTDEPPLGVNTFFEQEVDESAIRHSMDMIRAAGFRWIRQQFAWYEIERPAKGQYVDSASGGSSWEKYDRIIRLAEEYGLQVLVRIDTVPDWARPEGSTFTHPPTDLNNYGDFVQTLVSRYRGRVGYVQLWNEPNLAFEWGNQDVRASDFVPLLQAGYTAAKRANPQVTVVSAALAPTIDRGPANRNDVLYLQEMYAAGAKGYFDVMSTMAYGLTSGPDDRRVDAFWQVNVSRSLLLRRVMVENGDSDKPIWFSELAWNALPLSFTEQALYGRVTEEQQGRYTVRALRRIEEEWPWASVSFIWFFRRPSDSERSQQFYYFRLVEPDFTPLPVYTAIREAAPTLRLVPRGWHTAAHWAVDRTGDWQQAGAGLLAASPGSALRFAFTGTDLSLNAHGPGRLYVDVAGTRLPRDEEGRAYIDLPAQADQVLLVSGLPDGAHQATLTVGQGEATISAIIVERYERFPVALIWAAALFAALWAIAWRVRR